MAFSSLECNGRLMAIPTTNLTSCRQSQLPYRNRTRTGLLGLFLVVLSACTTRVTANPVVRPEPSSSAMPTRDRTDEAASSPKGRAELGAMYQGVNLAGADFGYEQLPGEFGTDYTYPTDEEVRFFTSQGMNVFRLPFLWERLQPEPYIELNEAELARIDAFVDSANAAGATVVLDPHNYARYYDTIVGSQDFNVSAFGDFWARVASHFVDNGQVIFGLMNEPADMETELWLSDANVAIAAIRETGAKNLILVPGNDYTAAHSWNADWYGTPNSVAMLDIVDPMDNFASEVHQYLDSDNSGTSPGCVNSTIGSERLVEFTAWLYENDQRAFLGEFAGGENKECLDALDDMLRHIEANGSVWMGWTYWAAGPWWGDDIFEIEPGPDGINDAQMEVLRDHLPPADS